ncbi:TetR/AcrR family transcriptional regulator [Micromonospora sp. CA-240977]|uniref:TetR/AcrR family transcriptional regulator n=1 Tax=Micromonospora sp. CA-240977 TaxID=3239957 RepID=UPI003D89F756
MPRGIANPELREQLFDAAERVLLRDGPQALTGRAITREANCATGLLHSHFGDLEGFLTALIVRRFREQAEQAAALPPLAGTGDVVGNLTRAGLTLFEPRTLGIANLVIARPTLRSRVEAVMSEGAPGLPEVTTSISDYLDRERQLGRLPLGTDSGAVALAIVGTVHHLLLTGGVTDPEAVVTRLVRALVSEGTPGPSPVSPRVR